MWRLIDWRFLIPEGFNTVGYVGQVDPDELRILSESGVAVNERPSRDSTVHVLILTNPHPTTLEPAVASLAPGGWLLLRLGSRRARSWSRLGSRTTRAWTRRLSAHGVTQRRLYWHAPNLQRCAYIVDLEDRLAVAAMASRYQGVPLGRLKSMLVRAVNTVGLAQLAARDITIVGRRPPQPPPVNAGAEMPMPIDVSQLRDDKRTQRRTDSVILMTPWFDASRHVIAMYFDSATRAMTSVAKLPRRSWDISGIAAEAAALQVLNAEHSSLAGQVPRVLASDDGMRPYLKESALVGTAVGPDLVRSKSALVIDLGYGLVRQLGELASPPHAQNWYRRLIEEPLQLFSESVALGPFGVELVAQTSKLLEPLERANLPLVVEHGDLSHPNLFITPQKRMAAIDWERFEPMGLPARDLIFFLQYVSECRRRAITLPAQRSAFDRAFVGSRAWAAPWLRGYVEGLGVDHSLLPALILATWVRTSTGLVTRLAPSGPDASGSVNPGHLTQAFLRDRDFALWRHAVARYSVLLR
jgi:hypothetical protein